MKLSRPEWELLSRILAGAEKGPVPLIPDDAPTLERLAAKCARACAKNDRRVARQRERRHNRRPFFFRPKEGLQR